MADNLCGPSNPTKGLVGHFDRNLSNQQDRMLNSSPVSGSNSFRSTPQPTTGGDAAFAAFTGVQAQSNMMPASPLNHVVVDHQRGSQFQGNSATHPAARHGPPNTSWVADFQRMRLTNNGSPYSSDVAMAGGATVTLPRVANGAFSAPGFHQMDPSAYGHPSMAVNNVGPVTGPQYIPINSAGPFNTAQQSASTASQFDHYPRDLVFAHSTEEALEAAFAAYDDDFQDEMNQWMNAHGPSEQTASKEDADAIMTEIASAQEEARLNRDPSVMPQNSTETQEILARKDQDDFRKAAVDILGTLGTNQSEKFKNSSFLDLMRRISNREVVLQGDDLIDTATGAALEPESSMNHNSQPQSEAPAELQKEDKKKGVAKDEANGTM